MVAAIPDRWLQYKACGKIIEGTRIICFKVPLKRATQIKHVNLKDIWDIKQLLAKIPKLGAVLDLTNTGRYYNPKFFEAAGVHHKKILIPGRIIPPEDKVAEFMNALDAFLNEDDKYLVGVHCTHGLNRTGYMVCRYMRDRLGVPAADAIRRFEIARGYQMERDNYVADLLGKTPPPPDVGCHTIVKPINKMKVNNKNVDNDRHIDIEEKRGYYQKRKFDNKATKMKSKRDRRSMDDSSSERSDSYDFKFDY